jgi:hypothetical protein
MVRVRKEITLAAISLLAGSIATPIVYVLVALLAPKGFANLSQASAATIAYYFFLIWIASAFATTVAGGASWRFLHRRGWDSFAAYACIAAGIAALIGLVLGHGSQNWEAVAMAASNGLAVRGVERALR